MQLSISHPTDRENFTRVDLGYLTVWFSYRTPVAYHTPVSGIVVRVNEWGPTTGKHLNLIDGDKDRRIPGDEFEQRLGNLLDSIQEV